jgi:amidase
MFSPLSVQGPMARNVADLALFLDSMAGLCPHDPLTFDAPAESFSSAVARAVPGFRVAWTPDFGGTIPVDRETRELCGAAVRTLEGVGCTVEECAPALGAVGDAFLALRSQQFVIDRELLLQTHRDQIKPDIVWNTEVGLKQSTSRLAWAERERAAFFRRVAALFETYDLLILPGSATPAFDAALRFPKTVDGVVQETYIAASLITSAITMTSCPAVSVPCGLDQFGRPVGLQIVAPPRHDARALQAAALFERVSGAPPVPIDPRPGVVPGSLVPGSLVPGSLGRIPARHHAP